MRLNECMSTDGILMYRHLLQNCSFGVTAETGTLRNAEASLPCPVEQDTFQNISCETILPLVLLESLSIVRQDSHKGLGEQHGIVQPRNSAPPSGVREIQVRAMGIVERFKS